MIEHLGASDFDADDEPLFHEGPDRPEPFWDVEDEEPELEPDPEPESEPAPGPVGVGVCLADLSPSAPGWLWRGRIPLGQLTLVLGPRGTGKSFIALDLAARVTRGAPWPDAPETPGEPGSVLLLTAEDDLAGVVVPRLIAAEADLSRIHALTAVDDGHGRTRPFTFRDLGVLEAELDARPDLRLVVIDPAASFLGSTNDRRTGVLAGRLADLRDLAARYGVAVVLVNATDRGSTGRTWQYSADAIPFFEAAARSVWRLESDPDDPTLRLFLPARVNLAPDPGGLRFSIDEPDGRVAWRPEPVPLRGTEPHGPSPRRATGEIARAATWLHAYLSDGSRPAEDVVREGGLAGHARRALYAAKERLRVGSRKESDRFAGRWFWVPPGPHPDEDGDVSPCAEGIGGPFEDSKFPHGAARPRAEGPERSKFPGAAREAPPPEAAGPDPEAWAGGPDGTESRAIDGSRPGRFS